MAKMTEWTTEPVGEEPMVLRPCPVGIHRHRWTLAIEEAQLVVRLAEGEECPSVDSFGMSTCEAVVFNSFVNEAMVGMRTIPVSLAIQVEGDPREPDYVWLEITPTPALSTSEIVEEQLRPVREAVQRRREVWQPAIEAVLAAWADSGPYLPPEHQADLTDQLLDALDALDAKGTEDPH